MFSFIEKLLSKFRGKKTTTLDLSLDRLEELFNQAVHFYNQGQLQLAKETFEAHYQILQVLIARTRVNLGVCLDDLGDLPAARQSYETCLQEYQTLIDQGRAEFRPHKVLSIPLDQLASLF